jgi:hypothetical protein
MDVPICQARLMRGIGDSIANRLTGPLLDKEPLSGGVYLKEDIVSLRREA